MSSTEAITSEVGKRALRAFPFQERLGRAGPLFTSLARILAVAITGATLVNCDDFEGVTTPEASEDTSAPGHPAAWLSGWKTYLTIAAPNVQLTNPGATVFGIGAAVDVGSLKRMKMRPAIW